MTTLVRTHDARSGLNIAIILVFSAASATVAAIAEGYFRMWAVLPAALAAIGAHAFWRKKHWRFRIQGGVISWMVGSNHKTGTLDLHAVLKITIEDDSGFLTATLKDGTRVHIPMVAADGAAVRAYLQKHHPEIVLDFRQSGWTSPVV